MSMAQALFAQYAEEHLQAVRAIDFDKHEPRTFTRLQSDGPLAELNDINSVLKADLLPLVQKKRTSLLATYVNEIWLGESVIPVGVDTMSLLAFVVNGEVNEFRAYIEERGSFTHPDRLWTKLENLHTTVCDLFATAYPSDRRPITKDLICTLHGNVMKGLLSDDDVGKLRTRLVSPANSATQYAFPVDVGPRLDALIAILEEEMKRCEAVKDALCIGAWFFREFLLVHPFLNGNGRVARLVLSLILEPFVYVPVSLYMPSSKAGVTPRETYIGVLEGNSNGVPPLDVACYVCDCTLHQLRCTKDLAV